MPEKRKGAFSVVKLKIDLKKMSNNILDKTDNHTGPRTCPECGFQFPFLLFVNRYIMKYGIAKWSCPSCQEFITYNYRRTYFLWLVGFFVAILIFQGIRLLGWDLQNVFFVLPCIVLVLLPLYFGKFDKYKET